ncbi:MAG: hypothetical protein LBU42_05825, partial [Prevotellaceae bacterium]|nr:hypothetical protein [Prevotellaceae bacterium]
YPPNVTANNGIYTLHGTPPFTLTASDGTTQTVAGTTLTASALTITPITIRDKTECPGVFCPYQGSDLYIDATHFCQQRTSGAKNWEAWIKDIRDNKLYRIVKMPDNKWWLAQNVKYAGKGYDPVGCTEDECGRAYPANDVHGGSTLGNVQGICPAGWLLPVNNDWTTLINSIGGETAAVLAFRIANSPCGTATNPYGFANIHGVCFNNVIGDVNDAVSQWYSWNGTKKITIVTEGIYNCSTCSGTILYQSETLQDARYARVRCFRQL